MALGTLYAARRAKPADGSVPLLLPQLVARAEESEVGRRPWWLCRRSRCAAPRAARR
ncbi:MAG: hypothetical protein U1F25_16800 [Rubrivivax sp.]